MPIKSLWSRLFGAALRARPPANLESPPREKLTRGQQRVLEGLVVSAQSEDLVDVTDGPLEDWLAHHRDPGLWHAVADGLNYDIASNVPVLAWLLEQPDCQNAVAARIFVRAGLVQLCGTVKPAVWDQDAAALAQLIARRETAGGFPADLLCDAAGMDRRTLLARCLEANRSLKKTGRTPFLSAPQNLLGARPSGPLPRTDYVIEEASVRRWVRSGT